MPPVDSSGRAQEPFQSYLLPCGYFAHRMMGNVDPEQKLNPSRPSSPLPVSQQTLVRNSQGASSSVRLWAPAPPLCSVMHLPLPSSCPPLRPSSPEARLATHCSLPWGALPNTPSCWPPSLYSFSGPVLFPQRKETSRLSQFNIYNAHVCWLVYCLDYVMCYVSAGNTSVLLPTGFPMPSTMLGSSRRTDTCLMSDNHCSVSPFSGKIFKFYISSPKWYTEPSWGTLLKKQH